MKHRTLIIRGIETTDELAPLGQAVAERYADCDRVVLINRRGKARVVKGSEKDASLIDLDFIDAQDDLGDFRWILIKIKKIYEEVHSDTANLAHAFVGQWLFHWISFDHKRVIDTMDQHLYTAELAKSADEFIERDFGMSASCIMNADGTKKRGGIDSPATGIPGDDGPRNDLSADS